MIKGVGIDIVEIDRIKSSIEKYNEKFTNKLFTANEINYCSKKPNLEQHYAVRFAAKEAFSKSIGTGLTGDFRWHEIEILNNNLGEPFINLLGNLKEKYKNFKFHISLSHSKTSAVAVVIFEE